MSAQHAPRKTALVTGATQGIGRAIAVRLAEDGLEVAVNDLPQNKALLETLLDEISAKDRRSCNDRLRGRECRGPSQGDMVVEVLGGLDVVRVLANDRASVYGGKRKCIQDGEPVGKPYPASVDHWDKTLDINVKGTFFCYKYAAASAQTIKQGRGGRIIGPTSKNGKKGIQSRSVGTGTPRNHCKHVRTWRNRHPNEE